MISNFGTSKNQSIKQVFSDLKSTWLRDTNFLSSSTAIVLHESYQAIIGLGPEVVPLILEEMKGTSNPHWDWALRAITREDPVLDIYKGDAVLICKAWLDWGKLVLA